MTKEKLPTHWMTAQKELIPIVDLTDSHLDNIINLLIRKNGETVRLQVLEQAFSFQGTCRGDGAFDAMEGTIRNIEEADVEDLLCDEFPIFKALYKEWMRRH